MGERVGLGRTAVAELLGKTLFVGPIYQGYGKAIAEKRFTPVGFRMRLGLKDLELTLRTAGEVTTPLPITRLVPDRFPANLPKARPAMCWSAIAPGARDDARRRPQG